MGRISEFLFGESWSSAENLASGEQASDIQPDLNEPQIVTMASPIIDAGLGVAGYGALMSVDYASCEQTKARSLASLPALVVKNGKRQEKIANHPIAVLLSGMANEDMTSSDLMSWHRLRCDTFGTSYWRVEWFKGKPVALWPVLCGVLRSFDRSRPEGFRTIFELSGDKYNPAGRYFSHEVITIKTHVNKNAEQGVSLAKLAAEQIGLSVDLERFYRSMLDNGNHHLGHVEIPDKNLTEPQRQDLARAIEAKRGVDNAGKAPIFSAGAKWVTDQQTMKDASVIEQQEWVLQQVCRACNVPPWKVYSSTGTSYNGSQQANIDYVTDTILPDARAIEQAFIPVFRAAGEKKLSLKLNLKGLMRGDDAARSSFYREMVYAGVFTREADHSGEPR